MTFSVFPNRSHFLSFNSESPPTLKKPVFARTSSNAQTPSSAGSLLVNDYKPFPGLSSLSLSLSLSHTHTHTHTQSTALFLLGTCFCGFFRFLVAVFLVPYAMTPTQGLTDSDFVI